MSKGVLSFYVDAKSVEQRNEAYESGAPDLNYTILLTYFHVTR